MMFFSTYLSLSHCFWCPSHSLFVSVSLLLSVQIREEKGGEEGGKSSSAETEVRHSEWSWAREDERREGKVGSFLEMRWLWFFCSLNLRTYRLRYCACSEQVFLIEENPSTIFCFRPWLQMIVYSHGTCWNHFINISTIPFFYCFSFFPFSLSPSTPCLSFLSSILMVCFSVVCFKMFLCGSPCCDSVIISPLIKIVSVSIIFVLTGSRSACQNRGRASWAARAPIQRPARWRWGVDVSRCWGWWGRPQLCPNTIFQGPRYGFNAAATVSGTSLQYNSARPRPHPFPPRPSFLSRAWKSWERPWSQPWWWPHW